MIKRIFLLSGIVVLLDQVLKIVVTSNLHDNTITVISNFFNLMYVENTGAAWGILAGNRWFLIIMSLIAAYVVIKYFLLDMNITKLEFFAYGIVLGGIIGNLIDRIFHGYVIDYVALYFGNYDFPVFNLADSCMVVGVGLILIHLIIEAVKQRSLK